MSLRRFAIRTHAGRYWLPSSIARAANLKVLTFHRAGFAISLAKATLWTERSIDFEKYCCRTPFAFSLEPRCHGLPGAVLHSRGRRVVAGRLQRATRVRAIAV